MCHTSSTYIKPSNKTLQSSVPPVLRAIESPDVAACTGHIREEEREREGDMCVTFTLHQISTSAISKHTPRCLPPLLPANGKGENSDVQMRIIRPARANAPRPPRKSSVTSTTRHHTRATALQRRTHVCVCTLPCSPAGGACSTSEEQAGSKEERQWQ